MIGGRSPLFGDWQHCHTIIGLLVEKLGGSVDISESDVRKSESAQAGVLYVEIDPIEGNIHIEVLPKERRGPHRKD